MEGTSPQGYEDPNDLYGLLRVEKDLVTGFSVLFSYIEFSLKCSGFAWESPQGHLSVDWDRYGQVMRPRFVVSRTEELEQAVEYLTQNPPSRQILKDGTLDWEPVKPVRDADLAQILRVVRRVRNNLFHGGKFPTGYVAEPGRDRRLIESCIAVLLECQSIDRHLLPTGHPA